MMILTYLLIALLTFGGGGLIGYQHGKKIERAGCLQEQQASIARAEQIRQQAVAERIKEKRAYEENFMRILNERQKVQADLNQRMHELRTVGLWLDTSKACASSNRMSAETKNTRLDDRTIGSEKIRLPEKIEGSLLAISYDASDLADRYNDLRELCLPLVEVVD